MLTIYYRSMTVPPLFRQFLTPFARAAGWLLGIVIMFGLHFSLQAQTTINVPAQYPTIQAAIDAASDNDIINVASGTYIEQVNVNKSVTIRGESRAGVIVQAVGSGVPPNFSTAFKLQVNTIAIENLTIDKSYFGVAVDDTKNVSGFSMSDVSILNASIGLYAAATLTINEFSSVNISNSLFDLNTHKGIYLERASDLVVDEVTISNSGNGIYLAESGGIDINLKFGDYDGIDIKNSTFTNTAVSPVPLKNYGETEFPEGGGAIQVKARNDGSYATPGAELQNVTITNNFISAARIAVNIGEAGQANSGAIDEVLVNNNHLEATHRAVANQTTGNILLSCNWFGSTAPTYINAKLVSTGGGGNILNTVLSIGSDSSPSAGFQPSGSCICPDGILVTNTTTGLTYCGLQAAIDDVLTTNGHTLVASAGKFYERVTVTKELTILGAKANIDPRPYVSSPRTADAADESIIIAPVSQQVVTIDAPKVTINGFHIRHDGTTTSSDVDLVGTPSGAAVRSELTFVNNILTNSNGDGINVRAFSEVNVSNNYFNGMDQDGVSVSSDLSGSAHIISHNEIVGSKSEHGGIYVYGLNDVLIESNIVKDSHRGIRISRSSGNAPVTNARIYKNEITGTFDSDSRWGISVQGPSGGVDFTDGIDVQYNKIIQTGGSASDKFALFNTYSKVRNLNFNNNYLEREAAGAYMRFGNYDGTPTLSPEATVNATCNWFGTVDNAVVSSLILNVGTHQVYPYLSNGNDSDGGLLGFVPAANACGPVKVYADNTLATLLSRHVTIQSAVNAAVAGNAIVADAGVYTEAVTVDKGIFLFGAQSGVDPRPASGLGRVIGGTDESVIQAPGGQIVVNITASDVVLDGFQIKHTTTTGSADLVSTPVGAAVRSNVSILNNIIAGATDEGIQIRFTNNVLIEKNYVYDVKGDGINVCLNRGGVNQKILNNHVDLSKSDFGAVYVYGVDNVEIAGNLITGNNNGIQLGDGVDPTNYVTNINVHDNDVRSKFNNYPVAAYGLTIVNNASADIEVRNNNFIQVADPTPAATYLKMIQVHGSSSNISIEENKIEMDPTGANRAYIHVSNTSGDNINATCNWFGYSDLASIVGKITGSHITYAPWLISGTDDETLIGFQPEPSSCLGNLPVKRYSDNTLGTLIASYLTIQSAVTASVAGNAIVADAGVYPEHVVIDKQLTLRGANYGISHSGSRVTESTIQFPDGTTASSSVVEVMAGVDGVVIDGFEIKDAGSSGTNNFTGILGRGNNLEIRNNVIEGFNYNGLWVAGGANNAAALGVSGLLVAHNLVKGSKDYSSIYVQNAAGTVRNNKVVDGTRGIQIQPYYNPGNGEVYENDINAYITGIYFNYANRGAGGTRTWNIRDNDISVSTNYSLAAPHSASWAYEGAWQGISLRTFAKEGTGNTATAHFSNNRIDGSGAVSGGFWTTSRGIAIIDAKGVATFTGNEISNVQNVVKANAGSDVTDIDINNNIFTSYTTGAQNEATGELDATCNWWGTTVIGDIISGMSANVSYLPYSSVGTFPLDCTGGPVKVYADEAAVANSAAPLSIHMTIQSAVNAAVNGNVIIASNGTYIEQVDVNKSVTIRGESRAGVIVRPVAGDAEENLVTFLLRSPDIKIENLTITRSGIAIRADEASDADGFNMDEVSVTDSRIGVASFNTESSNSFSDIQITNSLFDNANATYYPTNGHKAVYFERASNVLIDNITVQNVGNGTSTGNSGGVDINLRGNRAYTGITITNSTFTNTATTGPFWDNGEGGGAVQVKASSGASVSGVTIEGNTVTGAYIALHIATASAVNVKNNTLVGVRRSVVNSGVGNVILTCNWFGTSDVGDINAERLKALSPVPGNYFTLVSYASDDTFSDCEPNCDLTVAKDGNTYTPGANIPAGLISFSSPGGYDTYQWYACNGTNCTYTNGFVGNVSNTPAVSRAFNEVGAKGVRLVRTVGGQSQSCIFYFTIIPYITTGETNPCSMVLKRNGTGGTNQWYKDGVLIDGATGANYTATENGNYKVVATFSGNSYESEEFEVALVGGTPDFTFLVGEAPAVENSTYTVCRGTNLPLSITLGTGVSYVLEHNGTEFASGNSNLSLPFYPEMSQAGSWKLIVTDANTDCQSVLGLELVVNEKPAFSFEVGEGQAKNDSTYTVCRGTNLPLSITLGAGVSYVLEHNGAAFALGSTDLSLPFYPEMSQAGNWKLIVTDANSGCQTILDFVLVVIEKPAFSFKIGGQEAVSDSTYTICRGVNLPLEIIVGENVSYRLEHLTNSAFVFEGTSNYATDFFASLAHTGDWRLTVTNTGSDCQTIQDFSMVVNEKPAFTSVSIDKSEICIGGDAATLRIEGLVPNVGSGLVYSLGGLVDTLYVNAGSDGVATLSSDLLSGPTPGAYTVTITKILLGNCSKIVDADNQVSLTINAQPTFTRVTIDKSSVCPDDAVPAVIKIEGLLPGVESKIVYSLNAVSGTLDVTADAAGEVLLPTSLLSTPAAGVYEVTITEVIVGECSVQVTTDNEVSLTINPLVTMNALDDKVVFVGNSVATIPFSSSFTEVTTYSWVVSGGSIAGMPANGSGTAFPSFVPTGTGTATITVTPAVDGCAGTPVSFEIEVRNVPDLIPLVIIDNPSFAGSVVSQDFVLEIYNVQPDASIGMITVYVAKPSTAFSIEFEESSDWNVVDDGAYYTLTTSLEVSGGLVSPVSLNGTVIKSGAAAKGLYTMTTAIGFGSGGETEGGNNQTSINLIVN